MQSEKVPTVLEGDSQPGPDLTVVIPTYCERDNVPVLIERIAQTLASIAWEVIVVDDDSPDGTADVARVIANRDTRVHCLRRIGRRGLAGACIEGLLAASAPLVAVIDADLQHDETLLPKMYRALKAGEGELAVGTRYACGGSTGDGLSAARNRGSQFATRLAQGLFGIEMSDPMSGFFMIRRDRFEGLAGDLSTDGFKILLDIVASSKTSLKTVEFPYQFRERHAGQSKLDHLVILDYLGLLLSKLTRGLLPVRFLLFALVGTTGVVVNVAALSLFYEALSFGKAQATATLVTMTSNFFLNNWLTYRDRRLKGFGRITVGLLTFYVVCSIGMAANVGVASWIFANNATWWLAGTAGALMGAVFNYAVSSVLTWRP